MLALGAAALGCAPGACMRRDYVFAVTGVVTEEDGAPLKGAEVSLDVRGRVYEAVTPVKEGRRLTDDSGGFAFTYISHDTGVGYSVAVRKDGFEPSRVSGVAPPAAHHSIRLKRFGAAPHR
jgi:hypothetical protein